jgi:sigma-B regulation protein RsbU (phosphoserine phosphatase)
MPAYTYETERIAMQPGDIFFLYTDGVTEAMNPDAEQFGQQQLQDTLESTPHKHPADLIHAVRARVERHAKGAPQSDDITMLAVKFKGRA